MSGGERERDLRLESETRGKERVRKILWKEKEEGPVYTRWRDSALRKQRVLEMSMRERYWKREREKMEE